MSFKATACFVTSKACSRWIQLHVLGETCSEKGSLTVCVVFSACFRRLRQPILPNRKRHTASSPLTLLSISFISVFTKILREHYRGLCHFVCSYLCDSHETTQGTGIIPASLASPEPSHQLLMCAWKLVCVWESAGTHRLDQLFKKMRGFANMPRQYLCGHSCI